MAPNDHDRHWRPFGGQMPGRAFREIGRLINLSQGKARLRSNRVAQRHGGLRNGSGRPSRPLTAPNLKTASGLPIAVGTALKRFSGETFQCKKRGGSREGDRRFSRGLAIGWWTRPSSPPPPLPKV
jgi:hypothetical protein